MNEDYSANSLFSNDGLTCEESESRYCSCCRNCRNSGQYYMTTTAKVFWQHFPGQVLTLMALKTHETRKIHTNYQALHPFLIHYMVQTPILRPTFRSSIPLCTSIFFIRFKRCVSTVLLLTSKIFAICLFV